MGPAVAMIPDCTSDVVRIHAPDGTERARYRVEIADTPLARARGLMFVEEMDADAGMLFVFEHAQDAAFWMRNTLIPLDMLFIDTAGSVVHVHANAIPHDETPIRAGQPVIGVLEINGGAAEAAGIETGDRAISPVLPSGCAPLP